MSVVGVARICQVEILRQWWPIQCVEPCCEQPAAYRFVFDDGRSTWLCPDCVLGVDDQTLAA